MKPPHHLPRQPSRNAVSRWQRVGLYAAMIVLTVTGGAWLVAHYAWGAGTGELPHPLELWMIRLHGAAAMAGLFFFGVMAATHVPSGWRMRRQRGSGTSMLAGMAGTVLTGYALYYFAPEPVRPALGNVHAAIGAGLALILFWHRRPAAMAERHRRAAHSSLLALGQRKAQRLIDSRHRTQRSSAD